MGCIWHIQRVPNSPSTKKSLSVFLLAAALSIVLHGAVASAADAGPDAPKKRAALFLEEARKIFTKDQWIISRKNEQSFTAVHEAAPGGATVADAAGDASAPLFVHVSITFTPRSASSTDCAVQIEAYRLIPRKKGEKSRLAGPFKADYPENTNYIRKVLEKAEDRVGERHPEYRAN